MKRFTKIIAAVCLLVCSAVLLALSAACTSDPVATITFETGVETQVIKPITAKVGSKIYPPADPEREGYRFEGWTLDGEPFEFDVMPDRDIALKAEWTAVFTISFDTGTDDFAVAPIVEPAGTEISQPAVHRTDYYLKHWLLGNKVYDFKTMPEENITLTAVWFKLTSGIPSMLIELSDKSGNTYPLSNVNRENYVDSKISIANTNEKFEFNNLKSSFKGRGNGSWTDSGNKKGYKIKFDKKQSLFGRAANKHWVIIACANFDDVSMSRNYLAYNMGNEVFDNIEYSTQATWIDVYVNGDYRGVYLLCEHVRVGDGRVDIESDYLTDNFASTGYLIEYDAYASGKEGIDYFRVPGLKYAFTMHSPDPEDCADEKEGGKGEAYYMNQVKYIQSYVAQVYKAALSGDYTTFAQLADADSFVDMYILHELFKNVDTGYSSFYLYKKPNGKLYAGPPWDFDATANGATDRGDRGPTGIYVAGTIMNGSSHCASELYIALYTTSGFKDAVRERWHVLSPKITEFVNGRLNADVYSQYKTAMGKNFAKWKNKSEAKAELDWINDAETLKKWLLDRVTWLDGNWK